MVAKIDIIIPAFNHSYFTCSLLKSIKNATQIPFNIIYVDNGSETTEFSNVVNSLNDINHLIIRNNENLGFVKAINQGLKLSTAEYICFQNNDTLVFNNCFERLILHLENQNAGIVSPIASVGGGRQGIEIIKSSWPWYQSEIKDLDLEKSSHKQINEYLHKSFQGKVAEIKGTIAFFCVVMPRYTFEKLGYLDERYGLGLYEDDDYCRRIGIEGLKILLALDVYVWHLASTTFKTIYSNKIFAEMLAQNRINFENKWK